MATTHDELIAVDIFHITAGCKPMPTSWEFEVAALAII
jgi:hypothetical protein